MKQQQQHSQACIVLPSHLCAPVLCRRLRVPWPQVRAFEQMWSMQALSLDAAAAQPKYESNSRAMQYLKVGAAAVGGGALLAVTGGLAAPAIAAGLGAAVTLAHGKVGSSYGGLCCIASFTALTQQCDYRINCAVCMALLLCKLEPVYC